MTKVLVIDNYDSFTFNLVHYLQDLNCDVTVLRNDELELEDIAPFDKIVLSPGPGIPSEAGLLKPIIEHYYKTKSILGVCLGQQAITEVFNGTLTNLESVYHGVSSKVFITDEFEPIFKDLPSKITVGRYHSWVVNAETLPNCLKITSIDQNNQIMSLRHVDFDVCGVQFHPESILTPHGKTIIKNWLEAK